MTEVLGIDHVYLTVRDLERSERFYDRLMSVLDFRKVARPLAGGDRHVHYFNRVLQLSLRPARGHPHAHDPYSPGLHHLCLRVADTAAVDAAHRALARHGLEATPPAPWPQYHDDYYATFLTDPDGLRLEIVNHMAVRKSLAERWDGIAPIEIDQEAAPGR